MSATTKEQTGNKKAPTPGGKKAANFVIQGSILAIAGIVVRLIGMLYRIPPDQHYRKKGKWILYVFLRRLQYPADPFLL